jgi:2-haloacid dehalogenase
MALLNDLATHGRLPWDGVFSAETVQRYKPDKAVYELAVSQLALAPGQIVMVAAHKYDLKAAHALGFRTAFVPRPLELGNPNLSDSAPDPSFDLTVTDLNDLADKLSD